ncbi:tripartite tricarboxylate transporter TctB family protein [Amycolatopsis albispora]|uniref:DUF1468 domain-containing protein n=1 Tax=Amycolatopsis albispora TaxID=1804986 RepID=A0A344KZM7_9PSEU|nr:tripartite tricarboxylate transporter TctB family protein [Amycolatopsis albispora]AXB41251.1 hypothetical protein A4R43_00910 [Amycolatopsis albispora]
MATATRAPGAYAPMLVLLLLAGLSIEEGLRLLLTVDPAAQADPAGWYVLVLGAVLAVTSAVAERPSRVVAEESPGGGTPRPATPRRDMAVCLLLVAVYAALLGTLGYVVAGVVVVFAFLRVISRYGWLKSTVYTLVINAVFTVLFELSGVVLPAGIFRF